MALVNSGVHTGNNFSENHPPFGRAPPQNIFPPWPRPKNFKEYRF